MLIKDRLEPNELKIMRCLDKRMELTEKEKFRYFTLKRVLKERQNSTKWQEVF